MHGTRLHFLSPGAASPLPRPSRRGASEPEGRPEGPAAVTDERSRMARRTPKTRLQSLVVGILAASAGAAFTASTAAALPKKFSPYHKLNIFTRVLSYVENNYIEDV